MVERNNERENESFLEAKGLTKIYAHPQDPLTKYTIFTDSSFKLTSQNLNFLIGESGSGKTTFFNILRGKTAIDAGRLVFNEIELQKLYSYPKSTQLSYFKNIGYVSQHPNRNVSFNLSLIDNLEWYYELYIPQKDRLPYSKRMEFFFDYIEYFGLEKLIETPVFNLSGGEIQRLSIVCALIHYPQLLLLDEPTSQLDHQTSERLMTFINKIPQKSNTLVLIATHNFTLIKNGTILEIKEGRILNDN